MAKQPSSLDLYHAMREELKKGGLKPVYAFWGEESFFLDRLQEAVLDSVLPENRDFNLDLLHGDEISADKVVDICRSYPMMAEKRTVIIRDFLKLFESSSGNRSDSEKISASEDDKQQMGLKSKKEMLVSYLKNPNATTLLILLDKKSPPAHSDLYKALKKNKFVTSVNFGLIPEQRLSRWIHEWASATHQLLFQDDAADLLAYHVGNNLRQLTIEIEKLSNRVKKEHAVTVDEVNELVGLSREFSMFNFLDALLEKETEKSMFIANHMIYHSDSETGEVIKLIGFLYTTFGKIWQIQRLIRKGLRPNQIQEETGIKSRFYFNKLNRAGQYYPLDTFPWIFESLLDADKSIKGLSKEPPLSVMLLTIKKITA